MVIVTESSGLVAVPDLTFRPAPVTVRRGCPCACEHQHLVRAHRQRRGRQRVWLCRVPRQDTSSTRTAVIPAHGPAATCVDRSPATRRSCPKPPPRYLLSRLTCRNDTIQVSRVQQLDDSCVSPEWVTVLLQAPSRLMHAEAPGTLHQPHTVSTIAELRDRPLELYTWSHC